MKELQVKFVRHGQTFYNLMHKMQGWSDAPLTDRGIADLRKTAQGLKQIHFDAFYSSDLKRAMDTAEIIMQANTASDPDLQLQTDANFREVGFGIFEGIDDQIVGRKVGHPFGFDNFNDFIKQAGINQVRDATKIADSSGFAESSTDVYHRMAAGFQDLLEQNATGSTILVVTHGGFIRMLGEKYATKAQLAATNLPENGSVTTVLLTDEHVRVLDFARHNDQLDTDQAV